MRCQRDIAYLLEDRIAVGDAPRRLRVADHPRVVVGHDRFGAGDAREHRLAAAGVAAEEVRLDKPGDDTEVRLHVLAVEPDLDAARRRQQVVERRAVLRDVVDDAVTRQDLVAEDAAMLLGPRRPVQPGADDDRDVVAAHAAGLQRFEDRRKDDRVWHRPRDVGDDDDGFAAGLHEATQRRSGDRLLDRGADGGRRIIERRDTLRYEHRRRVGDLGIDAVFTVGEVKLHCSHSHRSLRW